MKKYFLLLILPVILLTACEEDNGNGNGSGSDLIGTWTIESSELSLTVGGVDFADYLVSFLGIPQAQAEILAALFESEAGSTGTITFNADNTYTAMIDGESESGSWSLSSDGKTLTISGTDEFGAYSDDLTVESLSSSQMILTLATDSEQVDLDDDGTDETTLDYTMRLILKK